jgi:hypothetical protein
MEELLPSLSVGPDPAIIIAKNGLISFDLTRVP